MFILFLSYFFLVKQKKKKYERKILLIFDMKLTPVMIIDVFHGINVSNEASIDIIQFFQNIVSNIL